MMLVERIKRKNKALAVNVLYVAFAARVFCSIGNM